MTTGSRGELDTFLEAMADGVFIVDRSGTISYVNRRGLEMSGYERSEVIGRPIEMLVPERQRRTHEEVRSRYQGAPRPRAMGSNLDITLLRKDGSALPADIALSPVDFGGRESIMASVRDVSERKRIELELRKAQVEVQRLAVMEDRDRIGRELHDGAIQALFAVGMSLQSAAAASTDPRLKERVQESVDRIDGVIRDLRNYIFGLRPGILGDRQAAQALSYLAADFEARSGVVTVVDIEAEAAERIRERAGELVQLAREALSNVGRHASAATCRLSLRLDAGLLVLEVDDDGRGFDPGGAPAGMGLRNMRERAERLGGSLEIESSAEEGTALRIRLPG